MKDNQANYTGTIKITTPPGLAEGTEKKLRPLILLFRKADQTTINATQDTITWTVHSTLSDLMQIQKRLTLFDQLVHNALKNKLLKKTILRGHPQTEIDELKKLLEHQTSLTIEIKKRD